MFVIRGKQRTEFFILGVSGHLDVEESDVNSLEAHLKVVLQRIRLEIGQKVIPYLLTGLARGADQIVAQVATNLGWKLIGALPMPQDYFVQTTDFIAHPKALERFSNLLELADGRQIELDGLKTELEKNVQSPSDQAHRLQSRYIVNNSDAIMVLWDGKLAGPGACGTSYVVQYFEERAKAENKETNVPSGMIQIPIRRSLIDGPKPVWGEPALNFLKFLNESDARNSKNTFVQKLITMVTPEVLSQELKKYALIWLLKNFSKILVKME